MDKQFRVDDKCNQCGICGKVCPSENITMQEGKPVWNHHCEQCFACLQWCPKKAIQYGKRTVKYTQIPSSRGPVKGCPETETNTE